MCWLRRFHDSQLQLGEKIDVITDIWTVQGTQTFESLNSAFLRRVTQAEIGALSTSECDRSANTKRITQQQNNQEGRKKDQKRNGILLMNIIPKENETELQSK